MGRGQRSSALTALAPRPSPAAAVIAAGNLWLSALETGWDGKSYQVVDARHDPVEVLRYQPGSLLAVCGPPGVGKTTLMNRVLPAGIKPLCVDEIAAELLANRPELRELEPKQAWVEAFRELWERADRALEAGETTIVHMTGLKRWQQRSLERRVRKHGRTCHMILLDGDVELCLEGQRQRGFRQVPEDEMRKYAEELATLKFDIADRLDDEWRVESGWGLTALASVAVLDREAADQLKKVTFDA